MTRIMWQRLVSERDKHIYILAQVCTYAVCGREIDRYREIYIYIYIERKREGYRMQGHSRLKERERARLKSLTRDPNAQIKDI